MGLIAVAMGFVRIFVGRVHWFDDSVEAVLGVTYLFLGPRLHQLVLSSWFDGDG